ncbi:hypothetical protein MTO96_007046 [Rhipicephalus appendiculatus]
MHNTLEEIEEAQRTAQLERLSGTRTGQQVLRNLGMEPRRADEETAEGAGVSECVRRHVQVRPIPKNVNPEYNRERRAARARALIDLHARDNGAVYVDAAEYKDWRGAFAAAVVSAVTGETNAAASVRARAAHRAEEVAIALALADTGCTTVRSDSRTAVRNYARGRVCVAAVRVLRAVNLADRTVTIK